MSKSNLILPASSTQLPNSELWSTQFMKGNEAFMARFVHDPLLIKQMVMANAFFVTTTFGRMINPLKKYLGLRLDDTSVEFDAFNFLYNHLCRELICKDWRHPRFHHKLPRVLVGIDASGTRGRKATLESVRKLHTHSIILFQPCDRDTGARILANAEAEMRGSLREAYKNAPHTRGLLSDKIECVPYNRDRRSLLHLGMYATKADDVFPKDGDFCDTVRIYPTPDPLNPIFRQSRSYDAEVIAKFATTYDNLIDARRKAVNRRECDDDLARRRRSGKRGQLISIQANPSECLPGLAERACMIERNRDDDAVDLVWPLGARPYRGCKERVRWDVERMMEHIGVSDWTIDFERSTY